MSASFFARRPAFELFFSRYRASRIRIRFEINQLMSVVLPRKRAAKTERVFTRTSLEAVGDTNIQNRVTISVG